MASSSSLACNPRWSSQPGRMLRCFMWWVIKVCVICDSRNLALGNRKKKTFSFKKKKKCTSQIFCCCDITEAKPLMCNSIQSSFWLEDTRVVFTLYTQTAPLKTATKKKRVIDSGKASDKCEKNGNGKSTLWPWIQLPPLCLDGSLCLHFLQILFYLAQDNRTRVSLKLHQTEQPSQQRSGGGFN